MTRGAGTSRYRPLLGRFAERLDEAYPDIVDALWGAKSQAILRRYMRLADKNAAQIWQWAMREQREVVAQRLAELWAIEQVRNMIAVTEAARADAGEMVIARDRASRVRGAQRKLENDKKQAAKRDIRALWQDWQTGKTKYRSAAAFAKAALEQVPEIENNKSVERWCTAWRREAESKRRK